MRKEAPQTPSKNEIHRRLHGIKRRAEDFAQIVSYKNFHGNRRLNENLRTIFIDGASILAISFETGVGAENAAEALGIILATLTEGSQTRQGEYLAAFAGENISAVESQISSRDERLAKKTFKLVYGLNAKGLVSSDYPKLASDHKESLLSLFQAGNKDAGLILQKYLEDEYGRFPDDVAEVLLGALVDRKISLADLSVLSKFTLSQINAHLRPALAEKKDELVKAFEEGNGLGEDLTVLMVLGSLFTGRYESDKFTDALHKKIEDSSDSELLRTLKRYNEVVGKFDARDIAITYEISSKKQKIYKKFIDRILAMRADNKTNRSTDFMEVFHDSALHTEPRIFAIKKEEAYGKYSGKIPVLNNFGLNGAALFNTWITTESWTSYAVGRNIETIEILEKKRPGIALFLYKEYGITHFRRYPEELLLSNYDNHENKDSSYGVVIMADHDYNGALAVQTHLKDLLKKAGDEYLIRVAEVKSRLGLAKRLIDFEGKYGKIAFLVGGAHGSPNFIELGSSKGGALMKRTIDDLGTSWKNLFVENPDIVLISCSTGEPEGLGQSISEKFDATVTAPWSAANIGSFSFENGVLSASYKRRKRGHVFSAGKLVSIA